ncbi:MAG: ABC transporter permease [Gemmatimonadales bacterium]
MGLGILHAARSFRQRLAFTGFTLSLITVGVGAASAIFAVVHGALLKPLPYREPSTLYSISASIQSSTNALQSALQVSPLSAKELVRWREESRGFSDIGGYTPATVKLTAGGTPDALPGMLVSASLFDALGVPAQAGRTFRREEEMAGSGVAIISARLWEERFGRDPAILNRVVNIDDEPRLVIGVMPSTFTMFQPCDVWLPLVLTSDRLTGPARTIAGVGRLRAGASLAQALSELARTQGDLAGEEPQVYRGTSASALPLRESLFGKQRATLVILLAAVVLLVIIGAVNVTSLAGADAVARRTATMTRLALGASGRQLGAMRLREGALLAVTALPPALLGGGALLAAVRTLNPGIPVGPGAVLQPAVLGFAACVALVMGVVAMLPSAIAEASLDVATLAGAAARAAGGRRERLGRDVILASQVAVTTVLLAAATLLARNLNAIMNRWPGFEAGGVLVAPLAMSLKTYPGVQDRAQHVEQVLAEVTQTPGVTGAATIQTRFVLNETMQTAIEVEGHPVPPDVQQSTNIRHVSPSIFSVLRTRVVAGRAFDDTDRDGSRLVAVVNTSFARLFLGAENPVGMRVRRASRKDAPWLEIVGVVEDVADAGAGVDLGPALYVSYYQQNTTLARVTLVVRTPGDPARIADAVRRAIWKVDPDQAIESTTPLPTLVARSAAQPRLRAVLVTLFGGAGLLLVLTGIYATTQYSVLRRTREIGVRAALGAPPRALVTMSLAHAMRPAIAGLAIGALGAMPLASTMQSALNTTFSTRDAPALASVLAIIVTLVVTAAFLPARRAVTISPTVAMRG